VGQGSNFIKFLGLHWGQFPEKWEIKKGKHPLSHAAFEPEDSRHIEGMSGMTLAVPAWDVMEVLQMPVFEKQRSEDRKKISEQLAMTPVAESALERPSGEVAADNLRHREDFNRLLNVAAKTPPQDDET